MLTKALFTLLIAGSLLIPHISSARGESAVNLGTSKIKLRSAEGIARLPAPQFDKVPWLNFGFTSTPSRSDLVIGPKVDTPAPFFLQPASPATQFSSSWEFEPQFMTE